MRTKKTRIVCKPVTIPFTSPNSGQEYHIDVWQECYTSPYKVDCQKWIDHQRTKGDFTVYRIFCDDND